MIVVWNKNHGPISLPSGVECSVSIMRPGHLGNPFIVGAHGTREEVVAKFRLYFDDQMKNESSKTFKAVKELVELAKRCDKLYLVCCCVPRLCHGQVLKEKVEELLKV